MFDLERGYVSVCSVVVKIIVEPLQLKPTSFVIGGRYVGKVEITMIHLERNGNAMFVK